MERERRWRRAESVCAREAEKGGERKGQRKGDREGKEETGTDRACYFQSLFPLYCLLWNRNKGGRQEKKKVHTDFKKSHFLFDRCGVSFAV